MKHDRVKLLLDQNLSHRLVTALLGAYPGSAHVRDFELQRASDAEVWAFAKARGFAIASKDGDFHQMSFLLWAPPKVIWLRVGNCSSTEVLEVLARRAERLGLFERDEVAGLLVLP